MEKKTLADVLEGKIFYIPVYQRGYAWGEQQWKDFVQDIDALADEADKGVKSHYTGTIVIYEDKGKQGKYGTRTMPQVEIVDGQQRLITCSLYLSIILDKLKKSGKKEYYNENSSYLYSGAVTRIRLNNDSEKFF